MHKPTTYRRGKERGEDTEKGSTMRKRTEATLWATMACMAAMGGMWSYGEYRTFNDMGVNSTNPLLAENVEALTGNETSTTWMVRESRCTVFVGTGKKIRLSDGTVLQADAAGFITIDGRRDFEEGGDASFRPVSCDDLYKTIEN